MRIVLPTQAAISVGATLLGRVMGQKPITQATAGKATTAIRGASRALKQTKHVGLAQESVAAINQQIADLEVQFNVETEPRRQRPFR